MEASGDFHWIDICIVAAYFVAVAATGVYAMCTVRRDTASGYFLAGRFMTFIPIGASLFASNIGSEHFIGLAGSGAAGGIGVGAFEFNALVLLQLLGWVFLPVYLSSGVYTLPEYLYKRFGGRRIHVYLSVLSIAIYVFTKISVNLYSGSLFVDLALGWDTYSSIFLLIGLTAFCTITGGLAAVIYTDTIQAFLMVSGGLTLMIYAFVEVGGLTALYGKYMVSQPANFTIQCPGTVRNDSLVMLRAPIGTDMPWPGFVFGQTAASIWYWCADQVIVQRVLAAKSLAHAQGGTLMAGYIKILPLFMIVMPGMISRVLYPDTVGCSIPDECFKQCGIRAGCSNLAYPLLIMKLMPTGLRGMMVAVMLAALVTDLTSIFNSASSLFTMDIYPLIRKRASNRELMIVGRLCALAMVGASIAWVPIVKDNSGGQLYHYIQAISAYLSPPIAAVFLTAILWGRANEKGAFYALMTSLITGGIRIILEFVYPEQPCDVKDVRPAFVLFIVKDVHYMYFALILFLQTAVVMITVSLFTKPNRDWQTVRTVFWRRYDTTIRPDELSPLAAAALCENERQENEAEVELRPVAGAPALKPMLDTSIDKNSRSARAIAWLKYYASLFCGLENPTSGDRSSLPMIAGVQQDNDRESDGLTSRGPGETLTAEAAARQRVEAQVGALHQSPLVRYILLANLVVILGVAVFLYTFFSIPPKWWNISLE